MRACVRAWLRACVRACVRARVRARISWSFCEHEDGCASVTLDLV